MGTYNKFILRVELHTPDSEIATLLQRAALDTDFDIDDVEVLANPTVAFIKSEIYRPWLFLKQLHVGGTADSLLSFNHSKRLDNGNYLYYVGGEGKVTQSHLEAFFALLEPHIVAQPDQLLGVFNYEDTDSLYEPYYWVDNRVVRGNNFGYEWNSSDNLQVYAEDPTADFTKFPEQWLQKPKGDNPKDKHPWGGSQSSTAYWDPAYLIELPKTYVTDEYVAAIQHPEFTVVQKALFENIPTLNVLTNVPGDFVVTPTHSDAWKVIDRDITSLNSGALIVRLTGETNEQYTARVRQLIDAGVALFEWLPYKREFNTENVLKSVLANYPQPKGPAWVLDNFGVGIPLHHNRGIEGKYRYYLNHLGYHVLTDRVNDDYVNVLKEHTLGESVDLPPGEYTLLPCSRVLGDSEPRLTITVSVNSTLCSLTREDYRLGTRLVGFCIIPKGE